jgi:parallel beta-helix repeat protein
MTVLDNTPRDQYTATGGQVAFSYTFEIAAEGDIAVLQNGVLLSLGTGAGEYAVTGVGSDTGGVVTLVTGATSGDIITLYRDMALERLTSYTNGGDFLAADVNNDYDRLWLALQQNTGVSNRALVAPNTDPTDINMTIPAKTARLGKLLQFNSTTGNPEVVSPTTGTQIVSVTDFGATGNGTTDDTAAIQAAINSAASQGLALYFPGTNASYLVTAAITKNSLTKMTIFGDGYESKIVATGTSYNVFSFSSGSNIHVSGIHFDLSALAGGNTWLGCGIYMRSCSASSVKDCFIYNGKRQGVVFQDTTDSEVSGNSVYNSSVDPAETSTDWGAAFLLSDSSQRNRVVNNRIKNCGIGVNLQSITAGTDTNHNLVSGNVIEDCYVYAVSVYTVLDTDQADFNIISNNIIKKVRGSIYSVVPANYSFGSGIYLQGANNCSVMGNFIEDTNISTDTGDTLAPGAIGITNLTECSIVGNIIEAPKRYGIAIFNPLEKGPVDGITTVIGNSINTPSETAIKLKDRGNVTLVGNTIRDAAKQGILSTVVNMSQTQNLVISDNLFNEVTLVGVQIENARRVNVTGNIIDSTNASGSSEQGIGFVTVQGGLIDGNTVDGQYVRGVNIDAASSNVIVTNNLVTGSTTGFLFSSAVLERDNISIANTTNYDGAWKAGADIGTPSALDSLSRRYATVPASGTAVLTLANGVPGQTLTLYSTGARTITNNTATNGIRLAGGTDFVMAAGDTLTVIYNVDLRWDEIGRKVA